MTVVIVASTRTKLSLDVYFFVRLSVAIVLLFCVALVSLLSVPWRFSFCSLWWWLELLFQQEPSRYWRSAFFVRLYVGTVLIFRCGALLLSLLRLSLTPGLIIAVTCAATVFRIMKLRFVFLFPRHNPIRCPFNPHLNRHSSNILPPANHCFCYCC